MSTNLENTLTKFTVNDIEYQTVDTETSVVSSLSFLWSLIELTDNDAYLAAREKKTPLRVSLDNLITSFQANQNLYFGDLISNLCAKGQAKEFGDGLRSFVPSFPQDNNDPLFLTQAAFAYLIALAQEGVAAITKEQETEPPAVEPPAEKKPRKKKGGFGEKVEPEIPALEAIAGRELTPEEIAAEKTLADKPLEEAIATPLIPISDEELAKLRPDLATIEDQDLQAALAEQAANRLTIVSIPAPLDLDELEELG